MSKKPRKQGLPKALQAEEDQKANIIAAPTLEEFVNEMHGDGTTAVAQDGFPSREWLQDTFKTKSAIIRYLVNQGHAVKDIAKHLGMRYQHVRNVSTNPLKRGPNEDWRKPLLADKSIPDAKDFKPE